MISRQTNRLEENEDKNTGFPTNLKLAENNGLWQNNGNCEFIPLFSKPSGMS